jgi:sortase A
MRRALRAVSTVLIVAGVLLLLDAGLTLAWQEPVSALYARVTQNHLDGRLRALEHEAPSPLELRALAGLHSERRRLAFLARRLERRAGQGDPVGRIRIRAIGARFVVIQGTDGGDLRKGPGHYADTPLPGERGTVAIAGHRTTYLAPFRKLDQVHAGDRIDLEMPYGRFTYVYERTRIVAPSALWVTHRVGYDRLVLTACHPLYSASKRIVVFARLVSVEPRGAAVAR